MIKQKAFRFTLALLACMTAGQLLRAAPGCDNKDLSGSYGMLAPGNILAAPGFPAPFIGPFARVGRVVADGNEKSRSPIRPATTET